MADMLVGLIREVERLGVMLKDAGEQAERVGMLLQQITCGNSTTPPAPTDGKEATT